MTHAIPSNTFTDVSTSMMLETEFDHYGEVVIIISLKIISKFVLSQNKTIVRIIEFYINKFIFSLLVEEETLDLHHSKLEIQILSIKLA